MINLISPTTFTSGFLIADTYDATNGSVDSIPTLTQVGGQAASIAFEIQSTKGGLVMPRMTTAQRLALTPINGMEVYDTTLNSFYAYEAGAWQAGSGGVSSLTAGNSNIVLTPTTIINTGTIGLNPVLTGLTSAVIGNIGINTVGFNEIGAINTNGNLTLASNGTGNIEFLGTVQYVQGDTGFIDNVNNLSASLTSYTILATDSVVMPNTTTNSITLTLPASPTSGQSYLILDAYGNAAKNPIFINTNGSAISDSSPNIEVSATTYATGALPENIIITPNGVYAYICNTTDGTVTVLQNVNTSSPSILTTLTPSAGIAGNVAAIAVTSDGSRVWVTNPADGTVGVIQNASTATPTVLGTYAAGAVPTGIAFAGASDRMYVTNNASVGHGTTIFNGASSGTPTLLTQITQTGQSTYVAADADFSGAEVYVTGVFLGTWNITLLINSTVPSYASQAALTGTGPFYLTEHHTGGATYDIVYCTNGSTNSVTMFGQVSPGVIAALYTITVGTAPDFAVFSPNADYLYVANSGSANISVIYPALQTSSTPTVIATVAVGSTPTDIVFSADGQFAYVMNEGTDTVTVIENADTNNPTVLKTLTVGTNPYFGATSGPYTYVTDNGSNLVSVITDYFINSNNGAKNVIYNGSFWNAY